MLVTRSFDGGFSAWLFTPSASHFVCGSGEWSRNNENLEPREPHGHGQDREGTPHLPAPRTSRSGGTSGKVAKPDATRSTC